MFDVSKLTLKEVGEEINRTIEKLGRLQGLQSAMMEQDFIRIRHLIDSLEKKDKTKVSQCLTDNN